MIEEMDALTDNGTWDLVCLPARKKAIGCRWVFIVKVNPDGSIAQLKARLVTTQNPGVPLTTVNLRKPVCLIS